MPCIIYKKINYNSKLLQHPIHWTLFLLTQ